MAYNSYDAPINYDLKGYNYDGNYVGGGKEPPEEKKFYNRIWFPDNKETKEVEKNAQRTFSTSINDTPSILMLSGFESTDADYMEVLALLLAADESQRII